MILEFCPCGKIPGIAKTKHSYYVRCSCGLKGKHFRRGDGEPNSKKRKAINWWNKRIVKFRYGVDDV